jgi:hypothetical protein
MGFSSILMAALGQAIPSLDGYVKTQISIPKTMNIRNLIDHPWGLLSTTASLTLMGAVVPAAQAADFTLNFDQGGNGGPVLTHRDGTLDTTQWSHWGLTNISGINNRTGNAAKFNIYDTSRNGRDNDLKTGRRWGTPSLGNVLIIQEEDGKSYNRQRKQYIADDEARGGNITFDFANEVRLNSFSLLDIDDNGEGIGINGFDAAGNQVIDFDIDALIDEMISTYGSNAADAYGQSVTLHGVTMTQQSKSRGDNSLFHFSLGETYVANIDFFYPGSGAIADLQWSTVDPTQEIPEPAGLAGLLLIGGLATRRLGKAKPVA